MNDTQEIAVNRKKIGVRFLYTLLYFVVLEILVTILQLTALFQFICLFISKGYSNRVRLFSNKVTTFSYRVIRYINLNENMRPFPFNDFPKEIELPDEAVRFEWDVSLSCVMSCEYHVGILMLGQG